MGLGPVALRRFFSYFANIFVFAVDRGEKRRPKIGKMGQKLGGLIFGWPYNQLSYFSYLLFACGWAYNWDFTVCALL